MTFLIIFFQLIIFLFAIILIFHLLVPVLIGAPYLPSKKRQIEAMLKLAEIKLGDKVVDFGSGDGRLLIEAAKAGADCLGYEINPFLVWWSRKKIKKLKLNNKIRIIWKNFWKADVSQVDSIVLFGAQHIMKILERKLRKELKPGARVISLIYKFPNWLPIKEKDGVYLYQK